MIAVSVLTASVQARPRLGPWPPCLPAECSAALPASWTTAMLAACLSCLFCVNTAFLRLFLRLSVPNARLLRHVT